MQMYSTKYAVSREVEVFPLTYRYLPPSSYPGYERFPYLLKAEDTWLRPGKDLFLTREEADRAAIKLCKKRVHAARRALKKAKLQLAAVEQKALVSQN